MSSAVPPSHFPTSRKHPPIQPNAHPYAVKTTSSALLSRSNSSPHAIQSVKHHYVPPSPTRARHGRTPSRESEKDVDDGCHPSPLPTPPPFFSSSPTRSSFNLTDNVVTPPRKRADTLPPGTSTPRINLTNVLGDDLPSDPKQWSTEQLVHYLSTSLQTNAEFGASNVEGVLDWVRECGMTGREWLRLTDASMASTTFSDAQKSQSLENSRTLRTDVLRRRVWVGSSEAEDIANHSKGVLNRPGMSRQSSPFSSGLYRTSVSSVELSLSPSIKDTKEPITPPVTLQCSNPVSESFAQRYRDLAHIRVRRRGKVKGLVETWEREQGRRDSVSSKEGSVDEEAVFASDTESGSEAGVEEPVILRDEPLPVNELPSSSLSWADSTIVASDPLPPHTSINAVDEEEPSIEELLSCSTTLEGALAWEADIGLGETMKHVPTSTTPDPSVTSRIVPPELGTTIERTDLTKSRPVLDGGASSRHRNARSQNRVVTAIFTDAEEHCGGMNHAMGIVEVADDPSVQHKTSERVAGMVDADVQVSDTPLGAIGIPGNDRADIICALETSLASTRTELQVFKARLEAVEACLIRFEAVLPRNPVQSNFCLQQSPGELSKRDAQISTDDFGPGRTPGVMAFDKFHELDWRNITRAARAGIMSWICPYTSPLVHRYRIYCAKLPQDTHSLLRASNLRLSSVVAFPLLLCVALLRRVGLNRWLRRP